MRRIPIRGTDQGGKGKKQKGKPIEKALQSS
jgi:hypothetical protein